MQQTEKRRAMPGAFTETSSQNNWRHSTTGRDPIFSQYATVDLVRADECLRWDLAECTGSDDPARLGGIQFIKMQLNSISDELQRRKSLRNKPYAPAWPSAPSQDLRAFWGELRDRVTVLDLMERYFVASRMQRQGKGYRSRCPICDSTNKYAFSVSEDGRVFHCFRCHQVGDVFDLAKLVYRTTRFSEVTDRLADEFGVEKPAVRS